GGGGGLLGRAVLSALPSEWSIRSVHRRAAPNESAPRVEWVPSDLAAVRDWDPIVTDCDAVLNVAWYRWGPPGRFQSLSEGLARLLAAAKLRGIPVVQVSVPSAPPHLERELPYLVYKRRLDEAVRAAGLPYAIVRPSLLFGPHDVLLGVMLRSIRRYPVFPMFGDGGYRIAPVSARDVARLLVHQLEHPANATFDVGGPAIYRYRDVTDRMYALLGKRPRYWHLSNRGSLRLAGLLQTLGSTTLYAYEVEWLLSDTLGIAPTPILPGPLERIEPFLEREASELTRRAAPELGPIAEGA
ncbi:MAG: NAD(P)H-binding protein, partial [Thermoplasmata archaeon]|nr:NAD(P)H-binding protein [Thermoplasmata archaeon]